MTEKGGLSLFRPKQSGVVQAGIHSQGFSLVELSIVLVILGLLAGGVLTGQSLIRAAELRSVATDYTRYIAAIHTFRDKYFALAGDMTNATSFWPTATNGDGNGILFTTGASNAPMEFFGFWQQLALAGLIEGSYTGLNGPSVGADSILGTNAPKSRISNAGFTVYAGPQTVAVTDLSYFEGNYGLNIINFGTDPCTGCISDQVALRPEEVWGIDTKIDDGKPAYGNVRTKELFGHATSGCTNPAASATAIAGTAVYDLDNTANACSIVFLIP